MAGILPTSAVTTVTSGITTAITENILPVLGLLAFIIGISVVMALLDGAATNRRLDNYGKLWKK